MKLVSRRVALALLLAAVPAFAVDADALVRILSPAYLAEDLAAVCSAQDPSFMQDGLGHFPSVRSYAVHIRGEVVEGLRPEEAERVVKRAADAAKNAALLAVRARSAATPEEERSNLLDWCRDSALPFVRQIVAEHDRNHAAVEHALDVAKRPNPSK